MIVKPFKPGGVMLGQLARSRFNVLLGGPPHSGKSVGAASYFGGDRGKALWFAVEHGQEGGAGGATPLLYLKDINPRLDPEKDIQVFRCSAWGEFQEQFKWICDNAEKLVQQGYTGFVMDGWTELCSQMEDTLQDVDPRRLFGTEYSEGAQKRDAKRSVLKDLDDLAGSYLEISDYNLLIGRSRNVMKKMKLLPFTLVMTALDGDLYDEEKNVKIGIGPDVTGRKLAPRLCSWVDYYFHCERRQVKAQPAKENKPAIAASMEYVWRTANDPAIIGNPCRFFAKSRGGSALNDIEPADGAALLDKLGVKPHTSIIDNAPGGSGPTPAHAGPTKGVK